MSKALRMLIVEDSEDDASLLARALRRAGYDVSFERVETAGTMTEALARQTWNLVIADYSMPHFSGTEALELLKKSRLDIPFIFVSGTIGEDTAVAAMKAGAQDYIMKGNLTRLIPAIERELREAEVRIQRRRAEQQVQLHRQWQSASHDINLAITSTLDLDAVLALLLEKIDHLLSYSAAAVRLFNRETGELEPVAGRNLDEEAWKSEEWRAGRGLTNIVFQTKAPVQASNLQTDPRLHEHAFFVQEKLASYLGVPLIAKGEILGVLSFFTREEHIFGDEEVDFLSTLAGQAAIAIQNSRLFEQTKAQAIALEKANKVKDEFLSIMSHELKTPITVIEGYARMMQERTVGDVSPEQKKVVGKILSHSNDLLTMVSSILDATGLETQAIKVTLHPLRLDNFLDELRSNYDFPLEKELVLNWNYPANLPPIQTDRTKLRQILQNLINNAIKFTDRGEVTVSARHIPETNTVEFKVRDTGIGICREALPSIFDIFRQLDSSARRSHGGIGLGLYIVKKFTDMLGGIVEVATDPGKGSTFTVTIPCGN